MASSCAALMACAFASPALAQAADAGVVAAERAFAQTAARDGLRAAFVRFADDSAIAFAPDPVNAKALWSARPASRNRLTWYPEWVRVARSGDLAVSTGPYQAADSTGTPWGYGHFVTIWRRTADGWRYAADLGVPTPKPEAEPRTYAPSDASPPEGAAGGPNEAAASSILATDSAFAARAASAGFAAALGEWADAGVRLLRPRAPERVGIAAAQAAAVADSARRYTASPTGAFASRAGDLGWSYGDYQYVHPGAGRRETGHYLRVWQREGRGPWRLVLTIDNPRPGERDE